MHAIFEKKVFCNCVIVLCKFFLILQSNFILFKELFLNIESYTNFYITVFLSHLLKAQASSNPKSLKGESSVLGSILLYLLGSPEDICAALICFGECSFCSRPRLPAEPSQISLRVPGSLRRFARHSG